MEEVKNSVNKNSQSNMIQNHTNFHFRNKIEVSSVEENHQFKLQKVERNHLNQNKRKKAVNQRNNHFPQ